jgi:hypothetical protein
VEVVRVVMKSGKMFERRLWSEIRARAVIGPDASGDWMTDRKGWMIWIGSMIVISGEENAVV